ncbi:type II toxin-antitoxin system RatA family toxin [Parendozoicomonas haliclonae]|uniref:Persistence and stress-resistance toxin PasT n=1 Tax=Parendozoicomonas haliclonae TaxID=1960125 RepID=A0A1X7AE61_9GAMM|nr:type II toxin-antitoxin system RatA family toxin [Parendozoicomonas haliclonae]SMA31476.1 Persistence and stress-resistance toxin PasT [Parendozoicomonas haliclonae]
MKTIERSALVMHSAQQMYDLVNNVEDYAAFLPWCAGVEVFEKTETAQEARLDISRAGVKASFITRNAMVPGERIDIALKEGPFSSLTGTWSFTALAEDACKVSLDLSFEMKSSMLSSAVGKVFEQVAATMVDAFCQRADQVYR